MDDQERHTTVIRTQDSRDYPGGTTLVTSRGHGETHTEFTTADLIELQRVIAGRIGDERYLGWPVFHSDDCYSGDGIGWVTCGKPRRHPGGDVRECNERLLASDGTTPRQILDAIMLHDQAVAHEDTP